MVRAALQGHIVSAHFAPHSSRCSPYSLFAFTIHGRCSCENTYPCFKSTVCASIMRPEHKSTVCLHIPHRYTHAAYVGVICVRTTCLIHTRRADVQGTRAQCISRYKSKTQTCISNPSYAGTVCVKRMRPSCACKVDGQPHVQAMRRTLHSQEPWSPLARNSTCTLRVMQCAHRLHDCTANPRCRPYCVSKLIFFTA